MRDIVEMPDRKEQNFIKICLANGGTLATRRRRGDIARGHVLESRRLCTVFAPRDVLRGLRARSRQRRAARRSGAEAIRRGVTWPDEKKPEGRHGLEPSMLLP